MKLMRPRIFEIGLIGVFTFSISGVSKPISSDPNVIFPDQPLQLEKALSFQRSALVRFPFKGDSVYSEDVQTQTLDALRKSGRWTLLSQERVDKTLERDLIQIPEQPYTDTQLEQWAKEWNVDTIWLASATKRGASVNVTLKLWQLSTKNAILEWTEMVEAGGDLTSTRTATKNALRTLLARIPFDGEVLSRNEKKLTLSIGRQSGVRDGQILVVTRIQSVRKRPSSQAIEEVFLQEIGRVVATKTEADITFAEVVEEDDKNPILTGHKIVIPLEPIQAPIVTKNQIQSPMEKTAFGTDAEVWDQRKPPSFGFVGMQFGLGTSRINDAPTTGVSQGQRAKWAPSVRLEGEIWLAKSFFLNMQVQQTMLGVTDSSAGLGLNSMSTSFSIAPGYRYLVDNEIDGPQIRLAMGYFGYFFFVDDTSAANSLTSKTYDGFTVFADFMIPFIEKKWNLGLGFTRTFFTGLSESVTSGGTSSSIAWSFFFRGGYKLGLRWAIEAAIRYESLASTYKNASRTSSSIRSWHFQSGINYYF